MDHGNIERDSVIERYLLRQLPQPEEEAFEEHLLGCSSCLRQLDEAEDFQTSLRAAVAEDLSRATLRAVLLGWLRRRDQLAIALLLGVLLLTAPATLLWWQNRHLSQPQANPVLVSLSATRGAGAGSAAPTEIHTDGDAAIILSYELARIEYDSYHFSLQAVSSPPDIHDKPLHETTLRPDAVGRLAITFPASFLAPGHYQVSISAVDQAASEPSRHRLLSTMAVRIVASTN